MVFPGGAGGRAGIILKGFEMATNGWLVMERKSGQQIVIHDASTGEEIVVQVSRFAGACKVAVQAAPRFKIARRELLGDSIEAVRPSTAAILGHRKD
jgi:sRNA-binding carbon storage regulator CsrA